MDHTIEQYDLRPHAGRILAAIDARLAALAPEKPLFVLMGESHDQVADKMLQKLLVSRLLDRANDNPAFTFAVGAEYPSNMLNHYINRITGQKTVEPRTNLLPDDPDGQRFLKTFLASDDQIFINETARNLNLFLYFNRISFSCNDRYCDRVCSGKESQSEAQITPKELAEIFFRNQQLARNSLDHCARSGARVYLLPCGTGHLFGMNAKIMGFEMPYAQSLSRQFREQNAEILCVADTIWQDAVPEGAADEMARSLLLKGLPDTSVQYSKTDFARMYNDTEHAWIRYLDYASGGEIGAWDWKKHRRLLLPQVKAAIPRWLAQIPA